MITFNVGNRVRRIKNGTNSGMNIGDTGTIVEVKSQNSVSVKLDKNKIISMGHDALNSFEKLPKTIHHVEAGDEFYRKDNTPRKLIVIEVFDFSISYYFKNDIHKIIYWLHRELLEEGYELGNQINTITINNKTYNKQEVEERLAELKQIN